MIVFLYSFCIFLCSLQADRAERAVSRENLLEEAKSVTIREDKSLPEAQCVSHAFTILTIQCSKKKRNFPPRKRARISPL